MLTTRLQSVQSKPVFVRTTLHNKTANDSANYRMRIIERSKRHGIANGLNMTKSSDCCNDTCTAVSQP